MQEKLEKLKDWEKLWRIREQKSKNFFTSISSVTQYRAKLKTSWQIQPQ